MFGDSSWPLPLRHQQRRALDALAQQWLSGATRACVALPPGAGKTLVGLEAARLLQRRIVVLGPNTAIQQQWLAAAAAYVPEPLRASTHRDLRDPVTVLTYQSLATFDPDQEVDEEGGATHNLVDRLHPNGRALVANLRAAGPLTLVLDECHHLLEVWGRLLAELLGTLPDAQVIGLTATPPAALTREQADLVHDIFGAVAFSVSVPAVVRDGDLAPFAELAWLTTPTERERQWLREEATRFVELTADLDHPEFATVALWQWLEARFAARSTTTPLAISWQRVEKERPELAAAALRFCYAGKVGLPAGARLREDHRRPPTAEDWAEVIDDYVAGFLARSDDERDAVAYQRLRAALPAIGWTLTKNGVRAGRSPADRVLARSESKTRAAVEIAAAEAADLGDRVRILLLADHEHATATLPATLVGVLGREAGSATLALEQLCADERTEVLKAVLVTGTTVACAPATATHLLEHARAQGFDDLTTRPGTAHATVELVGRWSPRDWVPLVTAYLTQGHSRLLIGTRALLGEGWDAPCVNVLIDLGTSTSATSVVQTRGRALRIDPQWRDKVAHTWSVTCVSAEHPKGLADWDRLARRHANFLALDESGRITEGVTHLNSRFSPFVAPPVEQFDELNAQAMVRAQDRDAVRSAWAVGAPYEDVVVSEVQIRTDRPYSASQRRVDPRPEPPLVVPAARGAQARHGALRRVAARPWYVVPPTIAAAASALLAAQAAPPGLVVASGAAGAAAALGMTYDAASATRAGHVLDAARAEPDLVAYACAVAEALEEAGLIRLAASTTEGTPSRPRGVVVTEVDPDGIYRVVLRGFRSEDTGTFATALDEVVSTIASPRYLIGRYVLTPRAPGWWHRWVSGWLWRHRRLPPNAVIYHAVPSVLATNAKRARTFAAAWGRWISVAEPVYANSAVGEGILATHRGRSPLDVTTALRVSWQ